MSKQFSRSISFKSITSLFKSAPIPNLHKPLTSLPQTSGAGAFVEPISYQVLGTSSNLLNIKLPKSSILNVRYNNSQQKIIAINGNVESLYSELARKSDNLIFQRCFNQTEPMSLLVSMNVENGNFAVINCKNNKNWIIKKSCLFAWSGSTVDPIGSSSHKNIVQIKGDGSFVLGTPGQISQINLCESESVHVTPSSIVGYSCGLAKMDDAVDELRSGIRSLVNLSIGTAPTNLNFNLTRFIFSFLHKYFKIPETFWKDPTVKKSLEISNKLSAYCAKIWSIIKNGLGKVISGSSEGYLVEVKGPRTLFITNCINEGDKVLSDEEIRKLL